MQLKLWHCQAARSIRPLWTMEEMGLEYEIEVMKFPPRFLHPGYTDINPIGTVPFFTDGNLEMTESAGISQYLVDRYGPSDLAVARDEPEYGLYLNWIHRSDALFCGTSSLQISGSEKDMCRWILCQNFLNSGQTDSFVGTGHKNTFRGRHHQLLKGVHPLHIGSVPSDKAATGF